MRIFIGISLTHRTREKLYDMQNTWLSYAGDKSPVNYENFHITLKFIGKLSIEQIDNLYLSLQKELSETKQFSVRINDIGAFNKFGKQLLWAGVTQGKDRLMALNKKVCKAIDNIEIETKRQKYHPHITLARNVEFVKEVSGLPIVDAVEIIDKVTIFNSKINGNNITYEPLYEINLE